MDVLLTPELEALVDEKVRSGMYNSVSEVIREGLRLLEEQDELRRIRSESLKKDIADGIAQAERGEVVIGEEVLRKIRNKHEAAKAKK